MPERAADLVTDPKMKRKPSLLFSGRGRQEQVKPTPAHHRELRLLPSVLHPANRVYCTGALLIPFMNAIN
jgi:hypothetical protein